jgi:cobalt-zinc-cadmium efflux system protein
MSGDHHQHMTTESKLKLVLILNAFFALVEFSGGFLTNSISIISNALHDAGDTIALVVAVYFQHLSQKKRDETYTFGYKRFTVLGALINSLILLSGSCLILWEAIPRLFHPAEINQQGMFLFSILGIIMNAIAMFTIGKGHGQNEKVISLHMLEDVLGWIAVLLISIVLYFRNIPILDPVLSVAITLFILFRLYKNLKETFRILLQGTPKSSFEEDIRKNLLEFKEISDVHDIHIWTLDGNYHVATLHLEVSEEMSLMELGELKNKVRNELNHLNIEHATLEIEMKGEHCQLDDC